MSSGTEIRVGTSSCGLANGAAEIQEILLDEAERLGNPAAIKTVGCAGMCHLEPLVEAVSPGGSSLLYANVGTHEARTIARFHLSRWPRGLSFWKDQVQPAGWSIPVREERIVLENCGRVDPGSIEDYQRLGGYQALERCVSELAPEEVLELVSRSGLRGRGGAGFPTARKWSLTRVQPAPRFVICNGDEGDPGAFMDRVLLEADPHRVVEGLAIAATTMGAREALFYIRAEYPLAVKHINLAIAQAEKNGILGDHVCGKGGPLRMAVREGAGAFVCGEETALIASLEGRRGTPRLRPPYPSVEGLEGRPTCIQNVETLACLPWIVNHGPEAFARVGTEGSKGTKVFALAGKIRHGGLLEVPMGTTIQEVVQDLGGGIPNGRSFKAVQIGGPSGGCLPASLAHTPIDYEALTATGAIMGSGGLVVLDDRDCMVDMSRYFLRFTSEESCGKCTFCRIGTRRMLEILDRLCLGQGQRSDLETLEDLSRGVAENSLCGLGQSAPNPVLTALRYFPEEFEAHLQGRCPAGRCTALVHYRVNDRCIGCTLCAQVCPVEAIAYRPHEKHEIDDQLCTRCGMCLEACQDQAIDVE